MNRFRSSVDESSFGGGQIVRSKSYHAPIRDSVGSVVFGSAFPFRPPSPKHKKILPKISWNNEKVNKKIESTEGLPYEDNYPPSFNQNIMNSFLSDKLSNEKIQSDEVVQEMIRELQIKLVKEVQARQNLELKLFSLQSTVEELSHNHQKDEARYSLFMKKLAQIEAEQLNSETGRVEELENNKKQIEDFVTGEVSHLQDLMNSNIKSQILDVNNEIENICMNIGAVEKKIENKEGSIMNQVKQELVNVYGKIENLEQRNNISKEKNNSAPVDYQWIQQFLSDYENHQTQFMDQRLDEIEKNVERALNSRDSSEEKLLGSIENRLQQLEHFIKEESPVRKSDLKRLKKIVIEMFSSREKKVQSGFSKLGNRMLEFEGMVNDSLRDLKFNFANENTNSQHSLSPRLDSIEEALKAEVRVRLRKEEEIKKIEEANLRIIDKKFIDFEKKLESIHEKFDEKNNTNLNSESETKLLSNKAMETFVTLHTNKLSDDLLNLQKMFEEKTNKNDEKDMELGNKINDVENKLSHMQTGIEEKYKSLGFVENRLKDLETFTENDKHKDEEEESSIVNRLNSFEDVISDAKELFETFISSVNENLEKKADKSELGNLRIEIKTNSQDQWKDWKESKEEAYSRQIQEMNLLENRVTETNTALTEHIVKFEEFCVEQKTMLEERDKISNSMKLKEFKCQDEVSQLEVRVLLNESKSKLEVEDISTNLDLVKRSLKMIEQKTAEDHMNLMSQFHLLTQDHETREKSTKIIKSSSLLGNGVTLDDVKQLEQRFNTKVELVTADLHSLNSSSNDLKDFLSILETKVDKLYKNKKLLSNTPSNSNSQSEESEEKNKLNTIETIEIRIIDITNPIGKDIKLTSLSLTINGHPQQSISLKETEDGIFTFDENCNRFKWNLEGAEDELALNASNDDIIVAKTSILLQPLLENSPVNRKYALMSVDGKETLLILQMRVICNHNLKDTVID